MAGTITVTTNQIEFASTENQSMNCFSKAAVVYHDYKYVFMSEAGRIAQFLPEDYGYSTAQAMYDFLKLSLAPTAQMISGNGEASFMDISAAVGSQISVDVPSGEVWKIDSLRFNFITDATVATRRVRVFKVIDGNIVQRFDTNFDQTASGNRLYDFHENYQKYVINTGLKPAGSQEFILPANLFIDGDMSAGFNGIQTNTTGFQAGDQFTQAFITYRKWLK